MRFGARPWEAGSLGQFRRKRLKPVSGRRLH